MIIKSDKSEQTITIDCDDANEFYVMNQLIEAERRVLLTGGMSIPEPVLTIYKDRIHIYKEPFDITKTLNGINSILFEEGVITLIGADNQIATIDISDNDLLIDLERAREYKGLSINELSHITDINKGTLSKYENGLSSIKESHVQILRRIFSNAYNLKVGKGNRSNNSSIHPVIAEAMSKLDVSTTVITEHLKISSATAYTLIKQPKFNVNTFRLCALLQLNLWDIVDPGELFNGY